MTKLILYNEYGAPIQQNPKICDLISWIFARTGRLFYSLNGGWEKLDNGTLLDRISRFCRTECYAWGDLQCYTRLKGYDDTANWERVQKERKLTMKGREGKKL